jgi:hypothetical protein
MVYFQFDTQNNNLKYIKIILIILLILLSITGFIYFYNITSIINTLNIIHIKTIKGKIDNIEGNITELFNYTEDISDYINDNNIIFEFNNFKNETRKKQAELEGIINSLAIENKQLQTITKTYMKHIALNYIKNRGNIIDMGSWFHINYNYNNDEKIVNNMTNYAYDYYIKNLDNLIKIDYNNFLISFLYFSNDPKENYRKIMNIFFDEEIIFDEKNIIEIIDVNHHDLSYFRYNYKFIYINVLPPVKFI